MPRCRFKGYLHETRGLLDTGVISSGTGPVQVVQLLCALDV